MGKLRWDERASNREVLKEVRGKGRDRGKEREFEREEQKEKKKEKLTYLFVCCLPKGDNRLVPLAKIN